MLMPILDGVILMLNNDGKIQLGNGDIIPKTDAYIKTQEYSIWFVQIGG